MTTIPLVSRRRFITISAAAAGLSVLPLGHAGKAQGRLAVWRGTAMGAVASMQIHHWDQAAAERLIARALAEVRRLERMFSLYRQDSALTVLNRQGVLEAPPAELVEVLEACRVYAELTDGVFDPTVQPLWDLYAAHFGREAASPDGPPREAVSAALARVGWQKVRVSRDRIAFAQRGMALTLNGIAQGYMTDRVVTVLRSQGIGHCLVDMGESRAVGRRPDDRPWQVGIADPDRPSRVGATLEIVDRAVATSGSYGFRFEPSGTFNHLFDPANGKCADRYRNLTVVMPTATAADALSTGFSLMPVETIRSALRRSGTGQVLLIDADGRHATLEA